MLRTMKAFRPSQGHCPGDRRATDAGWGGRGDCQALSLQRTGDQDATSVIFQDTTPGQDKTPLTIGSYEIDKIATERKPATSV